MKGGREKRKERRGSEGEGEVRREPDSYYLGPLFACFLYGGPKM